MKAPVVKRDVSFSANSNKTYQFGTDDIGIEITTNTQVKILGMWGDFYRCQFPDGEVHLVPEENVIEKEAE